MEVNAQEFFREDSVGTELRRQMRTALLAVEGVREVGEHDNESWSVAGNPSGQALAAAGVVDDLADRLRAGMVGS